MNIKAWIGVKTWQLGVFLGIYVNEYDYLYHVVEKRYGEGEARRLMTDGLLLEIDYPYTWQFRKYRLENK